MFAFKEAGGAVKLIHVKHLDVHRRRGDSRSSACTMNTHFINGWAARRVVLYMYSLKDATLPYRYAHPNTVVVDHRKIKR